MSLSNIGKPSVGGILVDGVRVTTNLSFVSNDSSVTITSSGGAINFEAAGGGGGGSNYNVASVTLNGTDITNKYIILPTAPATKSKTRVCLLSVGEQQYTTDFVVTTDDADKRLSWDGLGLESLLASSDSLIITYV